MNERAPDSAPGSGRRLLLLLLGALVVAGLATLAVWRGGVLGLPAVPVDLTAEQAGLAGLAALAERAHRLEAAAAESDPDSALALAASGRAAARRADTGRGLSMMRAALERNPGDLVLGNAYRMEVFRLRRAAIADPTQRETLAGRLPPELEHEPIATLERLEREHPSREVTLQLALAWVDELILHPPLEIKAPASVESVERLTAVLARDPFYVPALYARGLNYLHRPVRLVWPEARKAAPDAASRDLSQCVAIGRRIGGGSPRLVATLAFTLGDAYAKEGRSDRARSWWQIAQNASRDSVVLDAVRRRFGWENREMIDRLEAELESRMGDLDHPVTDLSLLWQ